MDDAHAARGIDDGATLVPRRDFLILSSAAVLGAVAGDATAQWAHPGTAGESATPLSLGFIDGTFDEICVAGERRSLTSVAQLGSASDLRGSVRVKIHGVVRADAPAGSSLAVDAIYRVADLGQAETPFHAWSDRQAGRFGGSSAARFVMPVESGSPLTLALSTISVPTWRAALARRFFNTPLPAQSARATATLLRRGTYFIAVPSDGKPGPNWASIRVVPPVNGTLPQLEEPALFGSRRVSFDYIVVGTERA